MKKYIMFLTLLTLGMSTRVAGQSAPPPTIKFYADDVALDNAKGVTVAQLSQLRVKVVPDSAFAATHPNDVKYGLRYIMYFRHGTNLSQPQSGTAELLGPKVVGAVQPGDVIQLEFEMVTRTDASGKREKMELDAKMKYVSIPVK